MNIVYVEWINCLTRKIGVSFETTASGLACRFDFSELRMCREDSVGHSSRTIDDSCHPYAICLVRESANWAAEWTQNIFIPWAARSLITKASRSVLCSLHCGVVFFGMASYRDLQSTIARLGYTFEWNVWVFYIQYEDSVSRPMTTSTIRKSLLHRTEQMSLLPMC